MVPMLGKTGTAHLGTHTAFARASLDGKHFQFRNLSLPRDMSGPAGNFESHWGYCSTDIDKDQRSDPNINGESKVSSPKLRSANRHQDPSTFLFKDIAGARSELNKLGICNAAPITCPADPTAISFTH
jgi:hypothetical protein